MQIELPEYSFEKHQPASQGSLVCTRFSVGFPESSDGRESFCMQETQVQSLGWEDPLEEEMATHSSIPAWRISWTVKPGRLQSMGSQRIGHN